MNKTITISSDLIKQKDLFGNFTEEIKIDEYKGQITILFSGFFKNILEEFWDILDIEKFIIDIPEYNIKTVCYLIKQPLIISVEDNNKITFEIKLQKCWGEKIPYNSRTYKSE